MTTNAHPVELPGYEGGPLTHRPELLEEPLFWLGHLYSCVQDEETEELLFGADHDAAGEFHRRLREPADWPTFTIPLAGDHRLHVVYRTFEDDPGTDYLVHHPDWDQAEQLAQDEGHFMGPGLSWPELVAAADGGLPGGSTVDPHARLLLLLPAFGDEAVPEDAAARLSAALRALTAVDDADTVAARLLEVQGATGQVRWTDGPGYAVNNGRYSYRNPSNHFALPPERAARVAAALSASA